MRLDSDLNVDPANLRSRLGRWIRAATVVLATLGGASVAWAEETTSPPEADKPLWQWVCMLGFVVLCCAVAFKNPKRSHMS
ncbi:MAG: hypothetical protein GY778_17080 [bacterium]|nr:hypothetical protein [bacterium]